MSASRPSSIETEDKSSENPMNVVKDPTHRVTRAQLLAKAGAGVALTLDAAEPAAGVEGALGAQAATTTVPRPEATNASALRRLSLTVS